MDEKRLKHILKTRAEQEIPDTMNLRNGIMNRIQQESGESPLRPGRRFDLRIFGLRRIAIIVMLAVALGTTAFVVAQGLIKPDAGLLANENKIVQLNTTQTIAAEKPLRRLEVVLDYAYADSNRIAVGYHVRGEADPGTKVVVYTNPTLSDTAGRQYYWIPMTGQQNTETTPGETAESFQHSGIMSFDSALVTGTPAALDLKLRVDVAYTTEALRADDPYAMLGAGDTTFAINLPFNAGFALNVDQQVAGKDLSVQLRRVVISPSLTRLEICTERTILGGDEWLSWQAVTTLSVNGQPVLSSQPQPFSLSGSEGMALEPDARCRAVAITESLINRAGTWQLNIEVFHNTGSDQTLTGPWAFTFDVSK